MSSAPPVAQAPAAEPSSPPAVPGSPPPDPFLPGEVVDGRYLLLGQVGRSRSCTVWRARDEILRRDVAIKRLLGNPSWSPEQADAARRRAHHEGRVAARLHHPRLASIFDLTEVGDDVCLVMEFVDAPSLSRRMESTGPLDPTVAARVGAQVAEGLAAAHAAGVLQRDVKPANVLGASDGGATLTDFGVARVPDDAVTTGAGMLAGTPHFMAPEVARGAPAGPAADVYSLGATLFLAVEGRPPAGDGVSALEVLRRVAAGELRPMHRAGPLAPVLGFLLAQDPAQRPSAAEAAMLLRSSVGLPNDPWPDDSADGPADDPAQDTTHSARDHGAHPHTLVDRSPVVPVQTAPLAATPAQGQPMPGRPEWTTPTGVEQGSWRRVGHRSRPGTRGRRLAVGSLLGAAGVAGLLGGVVAVTNAASTAPLAAGGTVAPTPQDREPIAPPAVPTSAPPITPAPEPPPIADLGPVVTPPTLVAQAEPTGDGSSHHRHRSSGGKHRSNDSGSNSDSGSDSDSGSHDHGGGKHHDSSSDDSGSGHGKHHDDD